MDLDELLATSAPSTTPLTPQLRRELDDLVEASERSRSRSRRSVRALVAGGVLTGSLTLGAVVAAAGLVPGWAPFATSSGQSCDIELSVTAPRPGDGEPVSRTFTSAQAQAALTEARAFLAGFDYDAVDRDRAISWWRSQEARVRASQTDPAERQPALHGDDLEVTAVSRWVLDALDRDLAAHDLDPRSLAHTVLTRGCAL